MDKPIVNSNDCIACEVCIEICPFNVINMEDGKAKINYETCSNCRICQVGAIK